MKTFFNILIIVGYLLFGTMWFKSLYQVVFYNSIVEVFNFKKTTTSKVEYINHPAQEGIIIVKYEFQVKSEIYKNEITASRKTFDEKVGISLSQIIYYNSLIPNANYIERWKLDNYYNLTFVMFSFFLALIFYFHLKVDKGKWVTRYKKMLGI